jgi:hypothetical protein
VIEETVSAVPRLLVSVAVFVALEIPTASLPNDKLLGETVACKIPDPVSDTV